MGIKAALSLPYAKYTLRRNRKWIDHPLESQQKVFRQLIQQGRKTKFGRDHGFVQIDSPKDFKEKVPVRDYEDLKDYFEAVRIGEESIVWPGKPIYLSKTSGTTSGAKYIPITKESIPYHIKAARDSILNYIYRTKNTGFVNGKMIFLQGSPQLDYSEAIPTGRLSGIVAHHVPAYLQRNRMPSFAVNCLDDWEDKVEAICQETLKEPMSLISGIPPWVQMYFEKLIELSGKDNVKDIFPDFSLFIYGGVNYAPYRQNMERLIGRSVDSIELYPASEGFIAYQDQEEGEGLLLLVDGGLFYEFIPVEEYGNEDARRLDLAEVELDKNYALVISSNAGLWAYDIGDTVRFVSLNPFRIKVSGRIKHFTSAFGEHVIAEEVEQAIAYINAKFSLDIKEFHLAPKIQVEEELPYHEWFIEFNGLPENMDVICEALNAKMCGLNPYYNDLIEGKILQNLKINSVHKGAFSRYMKSKGKLGGQNKLPRLANNREIADQLIISSRSEV
ncbi:MAG: hypothetical protein CMO34_06895 [Verrucomicrobia bacterium]|nr:hypothetical protein [Verrucomicrobiota bacterium]